VETIFVAWVVDLVNCRCSRPKKQDGDTDITLYVYVLHRGFYFTLYCVYKIASKQS